MQLCDMIGIVPGEREWYNHMDKHTRSAMMFRNKQGGLGDAENPVFGPGCGAGTGGMYGLPYDGAG
jgi:hypothetical protein